MLEVTSSNSEKYKITKDMSVSVKNTPMKSKKKDDNFYVSVVTLKVTVSQEGELAFDNVDEIAKYIKKLKIEDPQTKLQLGRT